MLLRFCVAAFLCCCVFVLLRASALFYGSRSLARTWHCYLTVCVAAATLSFALPLLPCRLRCRCYLAVYVAGATLPFTLPLLPYRLRCCYLACCIGIAAVARAAPLFDKI
ncbi:hypothetical protein [Methanimicrococcus blatticola]|uniref:hypothetical protein n=1 Tax=Methanimicrococcus blatticola TaxID=91560 RepID=UPI00105BF4FB|nr:hypothetical protein [Methanimicrococcus blatticola]MBZ3935714.1 hypothetical protein [Methanimicrococcus blatticola]